MRRIFIHGAGHTGELWSDVLARVDQGSAPSLPGRPTGAALTTIEECAQWLLRTHVQGERAMLVGNSMGGAIAMTAALLAPDRIAALVLVGSGARLRVHPDIFAQLEADFSAAAHTLARLQLSPGAGASLEARIVAAMERCGPQTTLADFRACDAFDLRDRLETIACPTLVISGSEDRMTPPKFSQYLQERIAGARLESLEGAGHVPQLERPERVAAAISAFAAAVGKEAETSR